jgi:hypothetical protein
MSDQLGFEELFGLWEEGAGVVARTEPPYRGPLDSVVAVVVAELRKRLGGTFTTAELARCYLEQGTEWCLELAMRIAPSTPEVWDVTAISGAAFVRCARFASDFGGGRRVPEEV